MFFVRICKVLVMPAVPRSLKQLVLIKRARFKENVVYHLKCVQISKYESLSSAWGSWKWSEVFFEFVDFSPLGVWMRSHPFSPTSSSCLPQTLLSGAFLVVRVLKCQSFLLHCSSIQSVRKTVSSEWNRDAVTQLSWRLKLCVLSSVHSLFNTCMWITPELDRNASGCRNNSK